MHPEFQLPDRMGEAILSACRNSNLGGGILCSGASGSGKTNIAEWVFVEFIRRGWPVMWFCPHGDSAKKIRRQVLTLPKSVQDNVLYVRIGDPTRVLSLRPLFVRRDGMSEYEYRARIMSRVGHVRHLLLSSVGEGQQGVVGKPLLRKWATTLLTTAALSGLNIADLVHFFDVQSEAFDLLTQLCPDIVMREQLRELPGMKPGERENEISSTRSRLLALLENVAVQMILGRSDEGVFDMHEAIDRGVSIIFDLSREGMLSHEDQKMIANLFLSEFLHCVMERPEHRRRDYLCGLDELPVFDLSAPLIQDSLTEIRKYRTKFWLSFQGSSRFEGRHENQFLNTIVAQCRVQLYLSHSSADAKFFAQELSLASYNAKRIKHEQTSLQQIVDGHEIVELTDHSRGKHEDFGESNGTTDSSTQQDSWGDQAGTSESHGRQMQSLQAAVTRASKESSSRGQAKGSSWGVSQSNSRSWGSSHSMTIKQTLVPVFRQFQAVTGIQFFSPEEWNLTVASQLTRLGVGECGFYVRGLGLCYGRLPLSVDRLAKTPKTASRRIAADDARLLGLSWFMSPEDIEQQRRKFFQSLLRELRQAVSQSQLRHRTSGALAATSHSGQQLILRPEYTRIVVPDVAPEPMEEPSHDAPWQI
jgi:hypothetical protein